MKAVRLIKEADVIIYDELGSQEALGFARPDASLVYVGKRGGRESIKQPAIDALLVQHCTEGRRVVRLKGGCPSVFSRLSSEVAALSAAGLEWELVPGISSALSAPLFAGFPLTHKSLSPSFTVVSGHDVDGTDWGAFAQLPTLAVLMAGRNLGRIVGKLVEVGWAPDTPVAVVRSAGLPEQRVWRSSLQAVEADTANAGPLSPCIVIIGRVAGDANVDEGTGDGADGS
ncbi:hypothetical protein HYH03_016154 [Edaphochlamys debaryana]|uniref:Tetrapyrrole methylase domain-containing protein n=1 Tax=Edaphochlamys debaryana TaxID=47281 RepID=A0A835XJN2_9CHLO|nr:hypothetical protein HYH03_016154 [Edaphochlamys debaryana]|eukprot:KAG2485056.1 hypothetical protein HYH03_016154 [Edaphochlamys debaryana]